MSIAIRWYRNIVGNLVKINLLPLMKFLELRTINLLRLVNSKNLIFDYSNQATSLLYRLCNIDVLMNRIKDNQ